MTWFLAILVVAAIGGVAVVAAGRGGSMAETYDDRPDARVPADGPLTSADLRQVRFTTAFRGYRMSEVDALVERLAAELEPGTPRRARPDRLLAAGDATPVDRGPAARSTPVRPASPAPPPPVQSERVQSERVQPERVQPERVQPERVQPSADETPA